MARLNLIIAQQDETTGLLSEVPYRILTIKDFRDQYHPGLGLQNFTYLFQNDKIDYFEFGDNKYIVMTDKTRSYVPNSSPKRRGKS